MYFHGLKFENCPGKWELFREPDGYTNECTPSRSLIKLYLINHGYYIILSWPRDSHGSRNMKLKALEDECNLLASALAADLLSPMPVILRHQGGTFSVFKSATDGYEQLLVSDSASALSMIRYDPALGLWNPTPFYTPALEKVLDIRCYTMQIAVSNADKKPYIYSEVLLKSSGYVDILVNGLSVQATPTGLPVVTDQDGVLTLIVPTNGVSSYTFSLATTDDADDSEGTFPIDPTVKVYDALSKIQNGDNLKNAQTQTGQSLLQNSKLSDNDIDQAAKAIATAVSARDSVLVKKGLIPESRVAISPYKVRFGHDLDKLEGSPRGVLDLPAVGGPTRLIVHLSNSVTPHHRVHGTGLLASLKISWPGPLISPMTPTTSSRRSET